MTDMTKDQINDLLVTLQDIIEDGEDELDFDQVHFDSYAALCQLLAEREWKPIRTPPRDETRIAVRVQAYQWVERIIVMRWVRDGWWDDNDFGYSEHHMTGWAHLPPVEKESE